MKSTSKLGRDGRFWGLVMVAPTILGLMILNIIPFFQTIYMSFSKTKAFGAYQFCGLENYLEMFRNAEFWKANWNSIYFCILTVPVGVFLALILAVLEKRAGFYFSNLDAYLNVVGGLRIDEPAVDLAVAMALVSSLKDTPIRDDTVVFGEIGLAGELRSVSHIESRVSEAYRLGFTRCVLPYHSMKSIDSKRFSGVELIGVHNVREAFDACVQ